MFSVYKGKKVKVCVFAIAMLTRLEQQRFTSLQSRKWQLIGMSWWYRGALCGRLLPAMAKSRCRYTTIPNVCRFTTLGNMNDRKTNEIYRVPKNKPMHFCHSMAIQVPTNLNKILYTCRQVNCQTNVENLSVKWGHSEYLLKSIWACSHIACNSSVTLVMSMYTFIHHKGRTVAYKRKKWQTRTEKAQSTAQSTLKHIT